MKYEWAQDKNDRNFRRRGFDFAYASGVFEGPVRIEEDDRHDYGERRLRATGVVDGIELVVVYTDRIDGDGELVRRIISARRASRKERRAYHEQT
jgi:uncharacterized DUF497 family protein